MLCEDMGQLGRAPARILSEGGGGIALPASKNRSKKLSCFDFAESESKKVLGSMLKHHTNRAACRNAFA